MDLVPSIIEFLADAGNGVLGFVALRLQASHGFSRSLAILGQLLRGTLEFRALGPILFGARRFGGLDERGELHRSRWRTDLHQGWREGYLATSLELGQSPAQRVELSVALLQFQFLLVEQLDQKQVLLIDEVRALLCVLLTRTIEHQFEFRDLPLEDQLPFTGLTELIA